MNKTISKGIKVAIITAMIATPLSGCSSCERMEKDFRSDVGGGLNRIVTVYNADGEVMKTYEGKIDLETTEGGIVKFDLNGQRIMYYNCYVEVVEIVD